MGIERVFLGWDKPALRSAARWLRQRFACGGEWDMQGVRVVVPGARAGRRLLDVLAQEAQGLAMTPPRILTPGQLPEELYVPERPLVGATEGRLLRMYALRRAPREILQRVVPRPPEDSDWSQWLLLAEEMKGVMEELAAEQVDLKQVGAILHERWPELREKERWEALAELEGMYQQLLEEAGLADPQTARREALEKEAVQADGPIVLLATLDLPAIVRAMLRKLSTPVYALVPVPEEMGEMFDELGCVRVEAWEEATIDLKDEQLHVADRLQDQAAVVAELVAEAGRAGYRLGQVTVGLGDESLVPLVQRYLELAGAPARPAQGPPVWRSRPVLLLSALGRFFTSHRLDDFAAVLRHPDVQRYLERKFRRVRRIHRQWLVLLDRYLSDHLQRRPTSEWLGDPRRAQRLKAIWEAVWKLAPPAYQQARPLADWSATIAEMLRRIYGFRRLHRERAEDHALIYALEAIGQVLREQAAMRRTNQDELKVNLSEAIDLTVSQLASVRLPAMDEGPAVELLGWLELPLDEAPFLVIAGMNEGWIPRSVHADAFLPDTARRVLRLEDERRRLARDKAALRILTASRQVHLVAGRRTEEGDVLLPSRLLLSCPDQELVQRVEKFWSPRVLSKPVPPVLIRGGRDRFLFPVPRPPEVPLTELPVTAFRDYLACPYRFYLKHVLRLERLDDQRAEMDAAVFGDLAHEVLRRFGSQCAAGLKRSREIEKCLCALLDELARERFGPEPTPTVAVQLEQLRVRLRVLAARQAEWVAEGWEIVPEWVEKPLAVTLDVDGQPFTIRGKIDRIDRHEEKGWRLLDYKTFETAKSPKETHQKQGQWVDLQLPLYRWLIKPLNPPEKVELGYVQVCSDLGKIGLDLADWNPMELEGALEQAREVIRAIRQNRFWPPGEPVYEDEFAELCMDLVLDREERIRRSQLIAGS